MTVECRCVCCVCVCHWVMAGLGPSAVGNKSTASHFQSDITGQIIIGVWVRCLPRQVASGLRCYKFDSISDIFPRPLFPALLPHNGLKWTLPVAWAEEKVPWKGSKEASHRIAFTALWAYFFRLCQNVVWKSFKFQSPNPLILPNSIVADRGAW